MTTQPALDAVRQRLERAGVTARAGELGAQLGDQALVIVGRPRRVDDGDRLDTTVEADSVFEACALAVSFPHHGQRPWSTVHATLEAEGIEEQTIMAEVFSKEPLGPAVLDGNDELAQAVNWAIFATIQAEEWGITSANVDSFLDSEDDRILKFLGATFTDGDGNETTLDPAIGLPVDFAYQVIKQVGNYGEIFDRHLTPLGLQRGVNALWFDGGLMYAPPYR